MCLKAIKISVSLSNWVLSADQRGRSAEESTGILELVKSLLCLPRGRNLEPGR